MTGDQTRSRVLNFGIGIFAAISIMAVIASAQKRDAEAYETDCARARESARQAAQVDTWAKLEKEGRRLTNYEQIGRK